jgi:recombination DNA repair RAD52 pathway protein
VSTFSLVHTVNCVQPLKAQDKAAGAKTIELLASNHELCHTPLNKLKAQDKAADAKAAELDTKLTSTITSLEVITAERDALLAAAATAHEEHSAVHTEFTGTLVQHQQQLEALDSQHAITLEAAEHKAASALEAHQTVTTSEKEQLQAMLSVLKAEKEELVASAKGLVSDLYGARFRQECTLKDDIGSHACSLEALACA